MLNQIVLVGNLGGDLEVFFDSEGKSIPSFSLAFSVAKSKTAWIKVTCFSKIAEVAEKYLHKGAREINLSPVVACVRVLGDVEKVIRLLIDVKQ